MVVVIQIGIDSVVGHEQVGPSILIVVGRTHRTYARSIRNVCECPVAVVVIQNILPVLSYIQVGKAIIIVIAPDATQAVGVAGYPGLFRNIGKSSVAVVVVESISRRDASVV